MRNRNLLLSATAALMFSLTPLYSQQTTGAIIGTVTDPSGATVANVTITVADPSTGFTRTVSTNDSGQYSVTDVPTGTYKVSVTAPSFKAFVTNDVHVDVATTDTINAQLQVGAASDTVTVQDTNVQVQTDNAALGQVIDGTQVKELPLNGRSFVELTQLQPGVSAANNFDTKNKGLQGGVDMSVNGNPTTNNLFLIDGVNNNDVGSNRTILIYPSNEAIAEFKMLTNSFSAQYGQASGAIISIVTRSGTNAFHGSAFYDGRNDVLDSFTYFARQNANPSLPEGGKDKLRRNDWGYSVGGPIKRDKLFFFFSEEWNHEIRARTVTTCVPSAAEQAGDFSNPTCGEPTPTFGADIAKPGSNGHVLNSVDPAAATLLKLYPLPTRDTAANNWSTSLPTGLFWREENVRVDYNLTPKNVITGRYTQDTWSNPAYNAGYWGDTPFPALDSSWAQPSKSVMGRWTSTISNTLVNDAAFQYSNNRIVITAGGTDPGLLTQLTSAFPTIYPSTDKHTPVGVPQVNFGSGYNGGNSTSLIAPWQNQLDLYSFQDDVSKIFNKNVMKFGVSLDWDGKNEDTGPASSERPSISTANADVTNAGGIATGNQLANFEVPGNKFLFSETSTNVRAQLRWRDYEFYVTDNYKLTPRLTIDAGVRYSIMPPTFQPNNQITSFQPSLYNPALPASDACNGLWVAPGTDPCGAANKQFGTNFSAGTPGPNKYLINVNYHQFAPRVGVAWDLYGTGKTILTAGGGQFFQRERVSRYTAVANAPFALNASNVVKTLSGPTPAVVVGTASPAGGLDARAIVPNSWQWNLTLQQQLNNNSLFSISYVGNKGTHLTSSYDINQIPELKWEQASFSTGGAINALRPYSNYGTLTWWTHDGNSSFQGLETLFKTRVHNLQLLAAYTWSHAISDIVLDDSSGGLGSQTRTYYPDPRLDRGNGDTNRPNNFVANAVYNLPSLSSSNHFVKQSLGGWELSGITTAANGNSFSIYEGAGEDSSLLAIQPGLTTPYSSTVSSFVQTGYTAPLRPLKVPGQNPTAGRKGAQIVNPNAYTLVGYQIGTIPNNVARRGDVQGPNFVNTDLSLDKNWKVKERVDVQFRLDFFDLFNHANFNSSSGTFTPIQNFNCGAPNGQGLYQPCGGAFASSGIYTNTVITHESQNTGFGASTATIGNASRQIQYTLHINF